MFMWKEGEERCIERCERVRGRPQRRLMLRAAWQGGAMGESSCMRGISQLRVLLGFQDCGGWLSWSLLRMKLETEMERQ